MSPEMAELDSPAPRGIIMGQMNTRSGPSRSPHLRQELQSPLCSTCNIYFPFKDTAAAAWSLLASVEFLTAKGSGNSPTNPGSLSSLHREGNQCRVEEKGERAGGILREQLEMALDWNFPESCPGYFSSNCPNHKGEKIDVIASNSSFQQFQSSA